MFKFVKEEPIKRKPGRPRGSRGSKRRLPQDDYCMTSCKDEPVEILPIPDGFPAIKARLSVPLHDLLPYGVCFRRGYQHPISEQEYKQAEKDRDILSKSEWHKRYGVGSIYVDKLK